MRPFTSTSSRGRKIGRGVTLLAKISLCLFSRRSFGSISISIPGAHGTWPTLVTLSVDLQMVFASIEPSQERICSVESSRGATSGSMKNQAWAPSQRSRREGRHSSLVVRIFSPTLDHTGPFEERAESSGASPPSRKISLECTTDARWLLLAKWFKLLANHVFDSHAAHLPSNVAICPEHSRCWEVATAVQGRVGRLARGRSLQTCVCMRLEFQLVWAPLPKPAVDEHVHVELVVGIWEPGIQQFCPDDTEVMSLLWTPANEYGPWCHASQLRRNHPQFTS